VAFKFHQALFGYAAGHDILASSVVLSIDARQFLANATDLSGSWPKSGFERTYTGLPVPGSDFYAIFCTWLAPEMKRPGCVWSHVLLISLADLADINEFSQLRSLFFRPSPDFVHADYSVPLHFRESRCVPKSRADSYQRICHLIRALYETPNRAAVAFAENSDTWEDILLSVWSQQWPRLRRNFRFSTGSFSDRGPSGRVVFDIQISPLRNRSAWPESRGYLMIEPDQSLIFPQWIIAAYEDICNPKTDGLRTFLRAQGADVISPRSAFSSIVKLFTYTGESSSATWGKVLREFSAYFPSPADAKSIKSSILRFATIGERSNSNAIIETIEFLATEHSDGAFSEIAFDFDRAISSIWKNERYALLKLLAAPSEATGGNRWMSFAKSVAKNISGEEVPKLWILHPSMLQLLVSLRPILTSATEIWQLPERAQWRVIEVLERGPISGDIWESTVKGMLRAGTTVGIREIVENAQSIIFRAAMSWQWNDSPTVPLPLVWRDALRGEAERILTSESLPTDEIVFCAFILHPVKNKFLTLRSDIRELSRIDLDGLPEALQLPTAFLVVMFGLQTDGPIGAAFWAQGFFRVHDALGATDEPPEAWRLIHPYLPTLWFWDEWDRCEKLRRGLRIWLKRNADYRQEIERGARSQRDLALLRDC
jgi:hypothetical protein